MVVSLNSTCPFHSYGIVLRFDFSVNRIEPRALAGELYLTHDILALVVGAKKEKRLLALKSLSLISIRLFFKIDLYFFALAGGSSGGQSSPCNHNPRTLAYRNRTLCSTEKRLTPRPLARADYNNTRQRAYIESSTLTNDSLILTTREGSARESFLYPYQERCDGRRRLPAWSRYT